MIKYRIKKEYSPISRRVLHCVQKRCFLTWWWVDSRETKESAERLIKSLQEELND